jgi:hypothetical protein
VIPVVQISNTFIDDCQKIIALKLDRIINEYSSGLAIEKLNLTGSSLGILA